MKSEYKSKVLCHFVDLAKKQLQKYGHRQVLFQMILVTWYHLI